MTNAADRKSIREAEKKAALAERVRGEVIANLMSTIPGRQWLWEILESLNVFGSPLGPDPYTTHFLLGEQNAGKKLMADAMRFCPDLFIQAMRESNGRRTESDTAAAGSAGERSSSEDAGRNDQGRVNDAADDYPGPEVSDDGEVTYN